MALINCPECENKISDRANNCPNCGFPISIQKKNNKPEIENIVSNSGNKNKSVGCVAALICVAAVVLFLTLINKCSSDDNLDKINTSTINHTIEYETTNNSGVNNIEHTKVYKNDWKPAGDNLAKIGKVLVKNNIYGCGEYYIFEITSNEFALACTSDGVLWNYYVVYPNLEKIYAANENMYFESPY